MQLAAPACRGLTIPRRLPRVGSSSPADPRAVSVSEPHPQACFLGGGFCHLRAIRRQTGAAAAVCIPAAGAGRTHDLSGRHSTVHNQWLLKIKVKATGGHRADWCSGGQLVTVTTSAMTMPLMRVPSTGVITGATFDFSQVGQVS